MIKRKLAVSLMIVGVLLVAGAGSLFMYNRWDENRASQAAIQTAHALTALIREQSHNVNPSNTNNETLQSSDVEQPGLSFQPNVRLPSIEYGGNYYIGLLNISALDLSLPVMEFWSYPKLKISPCKYSGNPRDDNMVVMAHNYSKHFGNISLLLHGDVVAFTDAEGNEYIYEVAEIETINSYDISGMVDTEYDFTMFTCTYGGQARVAVRCYKIQ